MTPSPLCAALVFAAIGQFASGDQVLPMDSASSGLVFSKDGNSLAVVGEDKKVRIWDLAGGKIARTFEPQAGEVLSVLLASNGQFAMASTNGEARIRHIESGLVTATFSLPVAGVSGGWIVSTVDGSMLAGSGGDPASSSGNLVRVMDRSGKILFQSSAGIGDLYSMVFSPSGDTLVAAGLDTDIRLWDARTGELKRVIEDMKLAMFDLTYSPDGKYLATAGADRTIYLWDTESWKVARKITGQPETINAIRFSPDGTMLVTGGMNELNFASPVKVILWDFVSGRKLHTWTADHMVQGVSFSPDGKWVAVADGSKDVKMWAVPSRRVTSKR